MGLRETWDALDFQMLQRWKIDQQQEDLHLDFKLLVRAPEFSNDDKKNLARALSGFGNSDGGIIVWGVDTRKNSDGVNEIRDLKPIPNVNAPLSRAQELTGQAVTPIVDGVEHAAIFDATGTDGFIKTLVPASDLPPHMAGHGEGRYYKRSGDSFYRMEHFDVADMFGRRAKPVLEIVLVDTMGGYTNERAASYEPIVAIKNTGRGTARFPFLRIKLSPPFGLNRQFGLRNGDTGLPERPQFGQRESAVFAGGQDHVIHAGTVLDVHRIASPRGVSLDTSVGMEDLVVEYEVACDGIQLKSGRIDRTGAQIIEFGQNDIRAKYPPRR